MLSAETLHQWMIAEGLWRPRQCRWAVIHQRRTLRPPRGTPVQIDGSPHAWSEERWSRCTLIVFIDDASFAVMALCFVSAKTTRSYMETLADHLDRHGRPVALLFG